MIKINKFFNNLFNKLFNKFFNKDSRDCLYMFGIIIVLYFLVSYLVKPLHEGITFTPYNNSKLFTKPWNSFCMNPPPSCDKNYKFSYNTDSIGCNCDSIGKAVKELEPDCNTIDYTHFF